MIEAAAVEAQSMSVAVTIVVVDESGVLKEMLRIDGAPLVSVQTAIAGAIGVAGAMTGAEDRSIAEAALKSLEK
jgi:uncharacterized protein GlcG (DUF336 family)